MLFCFFKFNIEFLGIRPVEIRIIVAEQGSSDTLLKKVWIYARMVKLQTQGRIGRWNSNVLFMFEE